MIRASLSLLIISFVPSLTLFVLSLAYERQPYSVLGFLCLLWPASVVLSSIVAGFLTRKDQLAIEGAIANSEYPELLTCPECQQQTDSLKKYWLPEFVMFIGIAGGCSSNYHLACDRCMRRSIVKRYLALLIPGNLVMLALTPFMAWQWLRTHSAGHSPEVVEALFEPPVQQVSSS